MHIHAHSMNLNNIALQSAAAAEKTAAAQRAAEVRRKLQTVGMRLHLESGDPEDLDDWSDRDGRRRNLPYANGLKKPAGPAPEPMPFSLWV